jgi:hypothetical protein
MSNAADLRYFAISSGALCGLAAAATVATFALQPPPSLAVVLEGTALEAESSMEVLRSQTPGLPTQFPPLPDMVIPDIDEVDPFV